jgi:hypothetical protein
MRGRLALGVLLLVPALAISASLAAQGQNAWIGTWKLNVAKSKYDPANLAPKSQTVKQEAIAGGGMKSVADGIDAQGKPTHIEIVTMFDGKASEAKGAPDANTTRVYKRIDSQTFEYVASVGGKVTTTSRSVLSADGKTRTVTTTGKNAQGVTLNNVAVYDRQ